MTTPMPYDIWVDFNTIHDGIVRTLRKFASPQADLTPGARVTIGDDEGTTALAIVDSVGTDDVVTLRVDASTVVSNERADVIRLTS
jgi:hypothetical protein